MDTESCAQLSSLGADLVRCLSVLQCTNVVLSQLSLLRCSQISFHSHEGLTFVVNFVLDYAHYIPTIHNTPITAIEFGAFLQGRTPTMHPGAHEFICLL
jgi:hypothetical protein